MFANLKNKLIEEVKASPSKFQQLANAAQAAVSSSSSSTTPNSSDTNTTGTNENFFSITEEDTPQNSPFRIQKLPATSATTLKARPSTQSLNGAGGAARQRKLSNSSMASDVSFRLPTYEPSATYHLQSDLDETGSEFDDTASTARLDIISKDQLYDAYKKSLDRYHKYRCRYTDLAKKYKELERDSSKARSVLVETQEKALRRISELREQCTLEQQAKAHLEEALRIEMDDMGCKMQAYQTKLKLLGENPDNIIAALERNQNAKEDIDSEKLIDLEEHTKNGLAVTNEQLERLKQLLADRETELQQLTEKHESAISTIATLRKLEEENVLLLAQTKQAIHTELEQKEGEVKNLQQKLKQLEGDLDAARTRDTTQANDYKEQLKKLQTAKQESDAKLIAAEHQLSNIKIDHASKEQQMVALQAQLQALQTEKEQNLQDLQQHTAQLNEMVQRYQQNELDMESQLNQTKEENATLQARLIEMEQNLLKERNSATLLQANSGESEATLTMQLNETKTHLVTKEKELKANGNKLNKIKKQQEQLQTKLSEQATIVERLNNDIAQRDERLQEVEHEKEELQARVRAILEEIATMQTHLQQVQDSHAELDKEKHKLEMKIEQLQLDNNMQGEAINERAKRAENKLEDLARENTNLAERNCLLEEQGNHLKKQLDERQSQQATAESMLISELRLQLQTTQDDLAKLQIKMQQVLDDHSRMQNAQELMDHDHRTLQDKCDAYEKEKLLAEDELQCAKQTSMSFELELAQLQQSTQDKIAETQLNVDHYKELFEELQQRSGQVENELTSTRIELEALKKNLADLEETQQQLIVMREERNILEQQLQEQTLASQGLSERLQSLEVIQGEMHIKQQQLLAEKDVDNADLAELREKCRVVAHQVEEKSRTIEELNRRLQDFEIKEMSEQQLVAQKQTNADQMQIENEYLNKHTKQLEQQLIEAQSSTRTSNNDNSELKEKLKSLQCELYVLQEKAEDHASQLATKDAQSETIKNEAEQLKAALNNQQLELNRQTEHASFVSEQSDAIQKELMHTQQILQEKDAELTRSINTIETLNKNVGELQAEHSKAIQHIAAIELMTKQETPDADHLRTINEKLQSELEELKYKSNGEQSNLQQEIDELQINNKQMADRIMELETLRASIQAQQLLANMATKREPLRTEKEVSNDIDEKVELEGKLKDIMNEVQEVTNRNLFLEQKCENFLILEQSNERLKLQNAKLSRQLDETLVSMQHSESVPVNTEFEYLRNIMFQYLTGNTNNETLVKVISAVLKFSPQQQQVALEKEHQRRSLLNKIL